eukprot:4203887-Amphidinium_carterae.1
MSSSDPLWPTVCQVVVDTSMIHLHDSSLPTSTILGRCLSEGQQVLLESVNHVRVRKKLLDAHQLGLHVYSTSPALLVANSTEVVLRAREPGDGLRNRLKSVVCAGKTRYVLGQVLKAM